MVRKNKRKNGIIIPIKLHESRTLENFIDNINEEDIIQNSINSNDELLINCSHELKTPLNIIYGAAQMIEISAQDCCAKNFEGYVNSIKNNCYRLTKYINHILDLTTIESGEYKLNLERVNIVEIIEYVVQNVASKITDRGLTILFDTNAEEKYVMIDPELFGKSILNIISNAVKFSKSKGTILVNFVEHNSNIEIMVKDDGIGIDKNHLENIFQRFGQVDKSLSRGYEGSGIGLKLANAIIELHGGRISVESILDEGSTFVIKFPLNNKDKIYDFYESKKVINFNSINQLVHIEFSDIFNIS